MSGGMSISPEEAGTMRLRAVYNNLTGYWNDMGASLEKLERPWWRWDQVAYVNGKILYRPRWWDFLALPHFKTMVFLDKIGIAVELQSRIGAIRKDLQQLL